MYLGLQVSLLRDMRLRRGLTELSYSLRLSRL